MYSYIEVARVYIYGASTIEAINTLLRELNPALTIIDDSIYDKINYPKKIRESRARRRHEEYIKEDLRQPSKLLQNTAQE